MNFTDAYDDKKKIVEEHLYKFLPELDQKANTVLEAMVYSLKAGGKRLRPVLLLSSCEFCGGDTADALPYACAIEMIHTYSLIHDDLPAMDDDDYRRGKLCNHKVYGDAVAILAGDGLLNTAIEIICSDIIKTMDDIYKTKQKTLAAKEIFTASGCHGMIGGQIADIESEGKAPSGETLEFIHSKKTTALLKASVRAGALLGNADRKKLEDLTEFAKNMGFAFQITDDILDVCGDQEILGKNVGSDEKLNKMTYPSLYGLEEAKKKVKELNEKSLKILDEYNDTNHFFKYLINELEDRNF